MNSVVSDPASEVAVRSHDQIEPAVCGGSDRHDATLSGRYSIPLLTGRS